MSCKTFGLPKLIYIIQLNQICCQILSLAQLNSYFSNFYYHMNIQNLYLHPNFVIKSLLKIKVPGNENKKSAQQKNINYFATDIETQIRRVENIVTLTEKLIKIKQSLLRTLDQKISQRKAIQRQIQTTEFYKKRLFTNKTNELLKFPEQNQQNGLSQINLRLSRRIKSVKNYITRVQNQNDQLLLLNKSSQFRRPKLNWINETSTANHLRRIKSTQKIQIPTFGQNYFQCRKSQIISAKQHLKIR